MTPFFHPYDDDGNVVNDGRWGYWYDAENRPYWMQTTTAAESAGHPRQGYQFQYDYLGRRIRKIEYSWSGSDWVTGIERWFIYEGWNLIGEYFGIYNGSFPTANARHFLWGKDLSGTIHGAGGVGGLLMTKEGGESYLPAYDTMGNVHAMIRSSDRAVVAAYEYDAFGKTIRESGTYAAQNPFRFSTKFHDQETGLIYYGLRYYSPSMGRFINRDPISERGGLNLYAFVGNNGVNRIDLLGMTPILGDAGPLKRWDTPDGLERPSGMSADEEWYGGYVPAGVGDDLYGFNGMTIYDDFARNAGSMTSSQLFDTYAPIFSSIEYSKYEASLRSQEGTFGSLESYTGNKLNEPQTVEQEKDPAEFISTSVGWQGTLFIPTPKALAAGFSSSLNIGIVTDGSLRNSRLKVSFNISPVVGIGAAVYQGVTVTSGRTSQSPTTGVTADGSFHVEGGFGAGPKIFNLAADWKPGESASFSPGVRQNSSEPEK